MLRLLLDLSQRQLWPLQLLVGHCDHRVRPDSADNAAHVARSCHVLGLPYVQAVADREQGHWAEVSLTVAVTLDTGLMTRKTQHIACLSCRAGSRGVSTSPTAVPTMYSFRSGQLCQMLGRVLAALVRLEVCGCAREVKCGCVCLQAPAREWRRDQLMRMAAESKCDFLALGHTATERAETVLLNMIRCA